MVLNETIISKHIVKPSFPTPNRFKTHKLSYLDQLAPPIYGSPIFFYQNNESKPYLEISQLLRQSLSQVLTIFYPFAGIIKENLFVECNDTGVEYVEAQVHAHLAQVIEIPEMENLKQLVAIDSLSPSNNVILIVKVNFFDCGGFAIGVCLSHKVGDFGSIMVFMNAWADICRGETHVQHPLFDSATHFPPKEIPSYFINSSKRDIYDQKVSVDREKLEKLQQKFASSEVKNPTKVEALSVFFCQQFIEATKVSSDTKTTSFAILHSVNLRPRTIPPIPNHTIGNNICTCFALTSENIDNSDMIYKLRAATRAIDNNYIEKVINTGEYLRELVFESNTKLLNITSIWKFPMYDTNFGWGKPVWVCISPMPCKNFIILNSTPSRDGIEEWINMSEDFFELFEINYNKVFS